MSSLMIPWDWVRMAQRISRSNILPHCERLQKDHVPTRVVSMPCIELFEEQSQDYRDEVLPPPITARLSIEAGVRQGWDRWVGPKGDSIYLDRFGASAPGDIALKNLGFNVENVLTHARKLVKHSK